MIIEIKNTKIFTCDVNCKYHWSKLPKFIKLMKENNLRFKFAANLCEANLCEANLCEADLCEADLRGADLCGADLCEADLCEADLRGANLRGADLCGADLCEANLCEANLRGANLRGADLRGANLRGADLCGADLCEADLCEADLRGAKKNTPDKIKILDYMNVQGLGCANRVTHFFKTEIGLIVRCGCFYGTEKAFIEAINETHGNNQYANEYLSMLKVVKIRFSRGEE